MFPTTGKAVNAVDSLKKPSKLLATSKRCQQLFFYHGHFFPRKTVLFLISYTCQCFSEPQKMHIYVFVFFFLPNPLKYSDSRSEVCTIHQYGLSIHPPTPQVPRPGPRKPRGNQNEESTIRFFSDFLSRKSDKISRNVQNQRHCQIFFSWERVCERFCIL